MINFEKGDRFDSLVFIKEIGKSDCGHRVGKFKCDCGNEIEKLLGDMSKKRKNPRSCGCIKKKSTDKSIRYRRTDSFNQELANKFLTTRL